MALFGWQYFFWAAAKFFNTSSLTTKKMEFTKSLNKRNNVLKFWLVLWKGESFLDFLSSILVLMSDSLMLKKFYYYHDFSPSSQHQQICFMLCFLQANLFSPQGSIPTENQKQSDFSKYAYPNFSFFFILKNLRAVP